MTPQMEAALAADQLLGFAAVEIALPNGVFLRLFNGSGELSFDGRTFVGEDATYGVLLGVEEIADGIDDEAPRMQIVIGPTSNSAAAALALPSVQGSDVTVWAGLKDPATGSVVANPELWFLGELDVPTLDIGRNRRSVTFDVASVFEAFFAADEGFALSHAFHQSLHAGELGFVYVTSTPDQAVWGSTAPRPALNVVGTGATPGVGGGSGGGGGGSGGEGGGGGGDFSDQIL